MHLTDISRWQHSHKFLDDSSHGERGTRRVIALTAVMMVIEIIAGIRFNSMSLLADGWHMSTHVAALAITALAYFWARKHAENRRFTFSTGKIGVLGGFASAVVLAVIALLMAGESALRLFQPLSIRFNEAIAVASVGLVVNLVSAWLLRDEHEHDGAAHTHHDHNLRAAYLHVLADALTSVTAIIALVAGKLVGWTWMDPIMGIVGAAVVGRWSYGLLRDTGAVLLDAAVDPKLETEIRRAIENDSDTRVADLHIWRISGHRMAAVVSVVTHLPKAPEYYKSLLSRFEELAHVTVEVNTCPDEPGTAA